MGSGHVWVALLNGAECIGWDASVVILNVSLSPQQGGSRCHHNLTVCWTSHDRAISGPGLPTCCQFHWSQSSQIINNVPAPPPPPQTHSSAHSIHLTLALCCFMDFFGRCYGLKIVSMCKKFLCSRCELRNQTRLIMCAVVVWKADLEILMLCVS